MCPKWNWFLSRQKSLPNLKSFAVTTKVGERCRVTPELAVKVALQVHMRMWPQLDLGYGMVYKHVDG